MGDQAWKDANQEKCREYRRKYYYRNKEEERKRIKQRKVDIAEWLRSFKLTLKCSRCPESHPACLEFHHLDPQAKELAISKVSRWGWSVERIMKEVAKCEVLCANCHRKEHHGGVV